MKKWNGDNYSTEIGNIGKGGKQDAVKGNSCNKAAYIYIYTGCNRRNGPDFGRVFLMLNYTENP